jgi:epoxyqueuosine reductase
MNTKAHAIQQKAYELGYEKCGIIPLSYMHEFEAKLEERIQKVSSSAGFYERQKRLIDPRKDFPWAKSIVIVAESFGHYNIPRHLQGRIGRHYLFDTRVDENTESFQAGLLFDAYLKSYGLQSVTERKFGLVGLRWAAMQAGLGIIRRNNFFYTQSGSWTTLYAWLIDEELTLVEKDSLPQCPPKCNRCIDACPTHSLSAPYTMNPLQCISFLTTFGGRDLANEPLSKNFGQCIYGCDICQDVCPMNPKKLSSEKEFTALKELEYFLSPEKIMEMDETFYRKNVQPKFFYLSPDELWKWKVNVLCFMQNNYQESYKPYIFKAYKSDNKKIQEMARSVYDQLGLTNE